MAVVAAVQQQSGGKEVDDVATDESDVEAEVIQDGIAGKAAAIVGKDTTFSSSFNQVRATLAKPAQEGMHLSIACPLRASYFAPYEHRGWNNAFFSTR
jgi:hypothetical protein